MEKFCRDKNYNCNVIQESWPSLVDCSGNGTQDNNKKMNKKTTTGMT